MPGSEQQVGNQVQRLLCTQRDQDLVRLGPHATARQHPGVYLLHQFRVVLVDAVTRPGMDGGDTGGVPAAFAPLGSREQVGIYLTVDERIGVLLPVGGLGQVALDRRAKTQVVAPFDAAGGSRRRCHLDPVAQDVLIDVVAAAFAGNQEALVDQMLISQYHSVASNV